MASDADHLQLLQQYAQHRDEQAFARVVSDQVNLVYSAALRRVGDRHLAEDVTQATFVILATKAGSFGAGTHLTAWLLQTVRYAAANAIRTEQRRRRHEREAGEAMIAGMCSSNPTDVLVWREIAPRIDDAVLKLSSTDRQAVLLRYFEGRSNQDVATALGVSVDAAKQRLSRAVARLRKRLGADGATLPVTALTALLAARAVEAAPTALASAAINAATTGVAAGAGFTIAQGALTMMTWAKAKVVVGVVVGAMLIGTGGALMMQEARAQDAATKPTNSEKAAQIDADGVVAKSAPVVVSTTPQAGAIDVDPSLTEIRVTFSTTMHDGSWSWVQISNDTFPKLTGTPKYLQDKRTCVLPVRLEPGKRYVIWINDTKYDNFMDQDQRSAVPYMLVFQTRKADSASSR